MSRCRCGEEERVEGWDLSGCQELRELKVKVQRLTETLHRIADPEDNADPQRLAEEELRVHL